MGLETSITDRSVHIAIIELISGAKHFVHIETSCFVSFFNGHKNFQNKIAEAIIRRIEHAYRNGEKFRILFLIKKRMHSQVFQGNGTSIELIENEIELDFLCRGEKSLLGR